MTLWFNCSGNCKEDDIKKVLKKADPLDGGRALAELIGSLQFGGFSLEWGTGPSALPVSQRYVLSHTYSPVPLDQLIA